MALADDVALILQESINDTDRDDFGDDDAYQLAVLTQFVQVLLDELPTTGPAGGDLDGNYPDPTVTRSRGILETDGPTTLSIGDILANEFLRRVGTSVTGVSEDALRALMLPRTAEISDLSTQSGLISGTALEWDLIDGSLADDSIVSLSSNRITIAQDNGLFWIQLQIGARFSGSSGRINFQMRDAGNSVITSITGAQMQTLRLESDSSLDRTDISTSSIIVDTTGADVVFDVDCVGVNNLSSVFANRRILIKEVR